MYYNESIAQLDGLVLNSGGRVVCERQVRCMRTAGAMYASNRWPTMGAMVDGNKRQSLLTRR